MTFIVTCLQVPIAAMSTWSADRGRSEDSSRVIGRRGCFVGRSAHRKRIRTSVAIIASAEREVGRLDINESVE